MGKTLIGCGLAVLGLAVLAALMVGGIYNNLVGLQEGVEAAWGQVENVYQRRLDLVPVLVDAVQTYVEHERETLTALTEARANAIQVTGAIGTAPQTVEQFRVIEAAQGEVGSALARLLAIVENYPDLKASDTRRPIASVLAVVDLPDLPMVANTSNGCPSYSVTVAYRWP